jgi:copper homeostasis protein
MRVLELCVDSVASALTAEVGGAHRIELCAALSEGGLTPSLGLLRSVRSKLNIPVHVMIRPRTGNFIYSEDDFAIMQEDIALAAQSRANGVVFGLLTSNGEVDIERTRALVKLSKPMQVTFHRAIDLTPDPIIALEAIIQTGADGVLTSGGELNATLGTIRIQNLVRAARSRIHVMVGGGVRPENLAELIRTTGAKEWHTSLRRPGVRQEEHAPISNLLAEQLGWEQFAPSFPIEDVRQLRRILDTAGQLETPEN